MNKTNVADQVIALGERFKAIIALAEMLKELGSVEDSLATMRQELAAAERERDEARAQLQSAKADLQAQIDAQAGELETERQVHVRAIEEARVQSEEAASALAVTRGEILAAETKRDEVRGQIDALRRQAGKILA